MNNYSYTNDDFKNKKKFSLPPFFRNKKIILIGVSILIFILLIIMILANTNNGEKLTNSKNGLNIRILGSSTITISKNENFLDPGYVAIDKNEGDLTNEVQITGIVDTSKVGNYTRYYTVINSDGTIVETTRTIVVLEESELNSTLSINLKGSSTVSIKLNAKYIEPGYIATDSKFGDVTKNVVITGKVDTTKIGNYTLTYTIKNNEGKTKEIKRTIIVIKDDIKPVDTNVIAVLTQNIIAYTKNSVLLTVKIQGTGYKYTILPDGRKTYNTNINYSVSNNSIYNFYVYDDNDKVQTLTKTISNIDKTKPNGSCSGKIENNKTIINVSASDNLSGVSYYIYKSGTISQTSTSNSYTLNSATKTVSVYIYDKVGNYTTTSCNISGSVPTNPSSGKLEVHFVNVGREDGIIIRSGNKVIVIDGGTYSSGSKMVDYLKGLGVTRVDYLIGSHLHYNHIQAHAKIINNFTVDKVYYGQNLFTCKPNYCDGSDQKYTVDALKKKNLTPLVMKNGDEISIDTNLNLKCIGPKTFRSYSQDNYPQNYNSLNFIITYGSTKFMFTGDGIQQSNVLKQYNKEVLNVDVLKHPHHGNHSLTESFVKTISPSYDILTSSRDELSSKQGTTKKYLLNAGTKLYYSYISKNILITSDGKNLSVKTNVKASDYKR